MKIIQKNLLRGLIKKSSCYSDLSTKLYDKSRKLKSIKGCKDMIEVWKQNLKQSSQCET